MSAQKIFGSPSLPHPFMHSITVCFFRWRRIIALWLGRRGSRPPAVRMAHTPPHLPGSTYLRYIFLPFFYLKTCFLSSDHPPSVPFTIFALLNFLLLYLPMAHLPTSQSTQLTPKEALVHDFDHVSLHPEPQTHSYCLPLHRGMNVRFRKLSLTKWLKFLYEGIQNYCYHCGKLDHTFNKCDKFLHHCDHHPFPPSLSYKDVLRAPAKSIYKKSIFELSNSIPFEEQPSLTNLDHHNSQDQTNSFLVTTVPTTFPATVASSTFIHRTTDPNPNITHPHQPQTVNPTLHCTLPTHPIMTTTTLPTISKGKAPLYPQPSLVSLNSPPLSSLNINDPPAAPSSTRKRSFARQTCQEYRDAQNRISISSHTSHHPSPRVQVPDDTYRLSVDAALSHSTNQHGYGAVVTDSKGTAIATFTATSHTALAPIFAEAEALHRALLWCQAVCFPIAVITSDCQTLVHLRRIEDAVNRAQVNLGIESMLKVSEFCLSNVL
ncbi:hypothetical protein G4B88_005654 [Cannabis sativa]|uniref:RNase H type-1 domain-containing protein n=1 Tax=Cannabis sativa TaxID=3483 RepID=A0A7J6GBF4_CANSA|nr:hypothetical protein G4B88_005654 [Cannabis sativa]